MYFDDMPPDIEELLDAAENLEDGTIKINLLDDAVRRADLHNDLDLQYHVRQELIHAAVFGGRHDLALVAYSWCLAQNDAHPDRFNEWDLLWRYKWIVDALPQFPELSRAQIEGALEDMERRYTKAGYSLRAVETMRWKVAMLMGEPDKARAAYGQAMKCRRDAVSDCEACVQSSIVSLHARLGDYERAIKASEKIRQGRLSCYTVPHTTFGTLLLPLFRLGEFDEAMALHRRGYRLIQRNPSFVDEFGEHLQFLTLTANHTKALNVLAAHLATALACPAKQSQFEFLRACVLALDYVAGRSKRSTIKLRLPPTIPFHRPDGVYEIADLQTWFRAAAQELAQRLDQRNGNDFYSQRLVSVGDMLTEVRPHPLSAKPNSSE